MLNKPRKHNIHVVAYNHGGYYNWHKDSEMFTFNLVLNQGNSLSGGDMLFMDDGKIITIPNKLPGNGLNNKKLSIGFDPRLHTEHMLNKLFKNSNCKLLPINKNLVSNIWKNLYGSYVCLSLQKWKLA